MRSSLMHPVLRLALCLMLLFAGTAEAKNNLASNPVNLPDLVLNVDLTLSHKVYHVETGRAYRLVIRSDGGDSYSFRAPDLFQQIWIDGIQVGGVTVKTTTPTAIDFGDAGAVTIMFVPIRPGKFDFWVQGYRNRGMAGYFVVE